MKKFIKRILFYLLVIFILMILLPYYLDPFNVFHAMNIRNNGVEPNKNYIKMAYLLANPDKFDTLMFGSSRVGSIHVEKISNERCYNMTYSAGVPYEHLQNIETLIKNKVKIKKIYIGVDSLSYTEDPRAHITQPLRIPYEYLTKDKTTLYKSYLDFKVAKDYLRGSFKIENDPHYQDKFYNYGWWRDYNLKTTYNWEKETASIFPGNYMNECITTIRSIKRICDENNIKLVIFTNPMYKITHKASLDRDYLLFLKRLAEITDFYNFSGYNGITLDRKNYCDTSHYNAEVGDLIIDCIVNDKKDTKLYSQGFGYHVTEKNADKLIQLLSEQEFK